MRRVIFGKTKGSFFEATFDTTKTKAGGSTSLQIKIPLSSDNFVPITVFWGDGSQNYINTYNSALLTHTYATSGIKNIKIQGSSFSILFSNGTESNKIISIEKNGNNIFVPSAFFGCSNLTKIGNDVDKLNAITNGSGMFMLATSFTELPTGTILSSLTNGQAMFRESALSSVPTAMLLNGLTNGNNMFYSTQITVLPSSMTLNYLTNAAEMFYGSKITALPSNMYLSALTNGISMFENSLIASLPEGMTLNSLVTGDRMFRTSKITALPSTMLLNNMTSGNAMFFNVKITSLPSGVLLTKLIDGTDMFRISLIATLPSSMTLNALTTGNNMFYNTPLNGLPSGVTLNNMKSGAYMFYNCLNLTTLPSGMNLTNLTSGVNMFQNSTLTTSTYSQLLININANNTNNSVIFSGGYSKYNSTAVSARTNLTTVKSWTITDGGLI